VISMNNLVAEVLISALVLSLILAFVPVMGGSLDLLAGAAELTFSPEEPPSGEIPPEDYLRGVDVSAVIRHYQSDPSVVVRLEVPAGSREYRDTSLEADPFPYPFSYDSLFETRIHSENRTIREIHFILKEE